jgi:lipopolysaccharide/colanic/teichoic acid biosynthesis glycosyltransferase
MDFFVHVPATSSNQDVENAAIDGAARSVAECAPYFAVKSAVDRTITAILMIAALPLMLVVALMILVMDGRPIFYRQSRVGKNGQTFRMWKFRTMCRNAESVTGVVWSSESDPRVTALGRWLRRAHLDELPQFLNVLAGDMNLIGPRPERSKIVGELARQVPGYLERLNAHPGITGLAQLRLGYDQSVADVRRKLVLDLEYIRTTSFQQDLRILLATIPYIARKLLQKCKADTRTLENAVNPHAGRASDNDISDYVHRPHETKPVSFEPHLSYCPNILAGFNASSPAVHSSPHFYFFTVHCVERAAPDGG